jgi:hypothetical protein
MKKNNNGERRFRMFLPFVIIVIIIFLIALLLSWQNINRFFARLGLGFGPSIGIMVIPKEVSYTIPTTQLSPGKVVGYWSFANDSYGNWNTTNTTPGVFRTFIVIYPENITSVNFTNATNYPITTIQLGRTFNVVVNNTNDRNSSVSRRIIVQLIDPDARPIPPSSSQSTDNSGQKGQVTFSYTAEKLGTYRANVFVWTEWISLPGNFPIAYFNSNTINSI